jgi:hypothetical protein
VRPFLVERDLAAIGQILPLLLGDEFPWHDVTVELRLDAAHCRALSAMLPGVTIAPARPRNVLSGPRELLDRTLPQADPTTAALCEQQCHDLLDRRQQRRGTAATVRSLLLRDPSNMPSMDTAAHREVAHRLGYSEVAAFSRAFKLWTGASPNTYRRR